MNLDIDNITAQTPIKKIYEYICDWGNYDIENFIDSLDDPTEESLFYFGRDRIAIMAIELDDFELFKKVCTNISHEVLEKLLQTNRYNFITPLTNYLFAGATIEPVMLVYYDNDVSRKLLPYISYDEESWTNSPFDINVPDDLLRERNAKYKIMEDEDLEEHLFFINRIRNGKYVVTNHKSYNATNYKYISRDQLDKLKRHDVSIYGTDDFEFFKANLTTNHAEIILSKYLTMDIRKILFCLYKLRNYGALSVYKSEPFIVDILAQTNTISLKNIWPDDSMNEVIVGLLLHGVEFNKYFSKNFTESYINARSIYGYNNFTNTEIELVKKLANKVYLPIHEQIIDIAREPYDKTLINPEQQNPMFTNMPGTLLLYPIIHTWDNGVVKDEYIYIQNVPQFVSEASNLIAGFNPETNYNERVVMTQEPYKNYVQIISLFHLEGFKVAYTKYPIDDINTSLCLIVYNSIVKYDARTIAEFLIDDLYNKVFKTGSKLDIARSNKTFQFSLCRLLTLSLLHRSYYITSIILKRFEIDITVLTADLLIFISPISIYNLAVLSKYMRTINNEGFPPGFADRLLEISPATYELINEAIEK